MKRPLLNLLVDTSAACLFLGMVATGLILNWTLPPGTNKSLVLWSLTRHQWGTIHAWISLALLICLALHLALHWTWVVTVVRREMGIATGPENRPWLAAVVMVVVFGAIVGLFAWLSAISVHERRDPSCVDSDDRGMADATKSRLATTPPTWADVNSLLRASCLECHGATMARGGFRVDRREDLFGDGQRTPFVIAGDSKNSPLIAIVSGRRDVPLPDRHHLRDRDIEILARWIDAGAKWSNGPE